MAKQSASGPAVDHGRRLIGTPGSNDRYRNIEEPDEASAASKRLLGRRDFLRASGLTASMLLAGRTPIMAMCGYKYDGPEGKLAFGPRMQQDFRAAFTTADGWGRFTQKVEEGKQLAGIELRYGQLELKELALDKVKGAAAKGAKVELDGEPVAVSLSQDVERYVLSFDSGITVNKSQRLTVTLS